MTVAFYDLIQQLIGVGSKEQLRVLTEHKDSEDIKELFRLMLCPSIVYNIKKVPKELPNAYYRMVEDIELIDKIESLLRQDLRGKNLDNEIGRISGHCTRTLSEVLSWVLDRKNPAKIGKSLVNKVWPDLVRTQVYMGAVSGSPVNLERLPWSTGVSVQVKEDGMAILVDYLDGTPVAIRTRQGNRIDQYIPKFFSRLRPCGSWNGTVHHELYVWDTEEDKPLDRKTGNGLINKCVKNGCPQPGVDNCIQSVILDHYSGGHQGNRYRYLMNFISPWSRRVHQETFYSLSDARAYTQKLIQAGHEGTVCKDPSKPFKDGKPWWNVKIKNEFEVELRVIGWKAHSKDSDKLGSLLCQSEDCILQVSVGSGFSDEQREDPWVYIGCIITVRAESVIRNKGKKKPSLYLPRFIEIRPEKMRADTYHKIKEQEEASRNVS